MIRPRWMQALREGVVAGSVASVLSTVMLGALGRRQGSTAGPINAVSHWLWGEQAFRQDGWSWRHTLTGAATQHAASVFWAVLYAAVHGHRPEAKRLPDAIAGGVALSATAFVIDYTITPKRFTPGYEERLDAKGMLAVYGVLALGFTLGALALRGKSTDW